MTTGPLDPELRRVSDEIITRLHTRGVEASHRDTPEQLARLLEAVEEFERTVEGRGGDLMVDEPIGARPPTSPDDQHFVLPARADGEAADAYILRVAEARGRVARHRRIK